MPYASLTSDHSAAVRIFLWVVSLPTCFLYSFPFLLDKIYFSVNFERIVLMSSHRNVDMIAASCLYPVLRNAQWLLIKL